MAWQRLGRVTKRVLSRIDVHGLGSEDGSNALAQTSPDEIGEAAESGAVSEKAADPTPEGEGPASQQGRTTKRRGNPASLHAGQTFASRWERTAIMGVAPPPVVRCHLRVVGGRDHAATPS